jgi:hypothetical protein
MLTDFFFSSRGQCLSIPDNAANAEYASSPAHWFMSVTPPGVPDVLLCEVDGCSAMFTGLYRRGNRGRHIRHKHSHLQGAKNAECICPVCDRYFKRTDARLKHMRKEHPTLELPGPKSRPQGRPKPHK